MDKYKFMGRCCSEKQPLENPASSSDMCEISF